MSPVAPTGWTLCIDFGTSNTAAAILVDGKVRPVPLEAGTTMPSAVVLTETGFRVGRPAENARRSRPDFYEGAPKRLLGQGSVFLGGTEYEVAALVGEVMKVVIARAIAAAGGIPPSHLVLTHPSEWGPQKKAELSRAAQLAGFAPGAITMLPEPLAAAHAYSETMTLPPGTKIAVVDFGGGTCDVAILAVSSGKGGPHLTVLADAGDVRLGGNDLDDRLYQWTLKQLRESGDDDLVEQLAQREHLGDALTLRTVVRGAKQDLSEHPDAEVAVAVAGQERVFRISRVEYEQLIAPEMLRAGTLLHQTIATAGVSRIDKLYLTGGSSHTPALAVELQKATGILAAPLGDPKLAVAEGALRFLMPPVLKAARPTRPVNPPPVLPPSVPRQPLVPGTEPEPVGAGRRQPWYRTWKLAPALVGVLVVLITGIYLLGNAGGEADASDDPTHTCDDGSVVAEAADCSTESTSTSTSTGQEPTEPPFVAIDCWNGSSTTQVAPLCPKLAGVEGATWAFPFAGDKQPSCSVDNKTVFYVQPQDAFRCLYTTQNNAFIARFSTPREANDWANGIFTPSGTWQFEGEYGGDSWTGTGTAVDGKDLPAEIRCYNSLPYCITVVGVTQKDIDSLWKITQARTQAEIDDYFASIG